MFWPFKLVEKGKISIENSNDIRPKLSIYQELDSLHNCGLIIEAIVEKLEIKHDLFLKIESLVSDNCIIASNTSSLSIASLGSVLAKSNRIIGIHFFNPAPLMPLVEVIPAVQTTDEVLNKSVEIIKSWGKEVVVCKDTPGLSSIELLVHFTEKHCVFMKKEKLILLLLIGQ